MPKCVSLRVPVVCAGVLVIMLGGRARADDCLLAPNRAAVGGERWVYQTDRATNRRCFYLIVAGRAVAPAPQSSAYDPYTPPPPSPFGWLFSNSPEPTWPASGTADAHAAVETSTDDAQIPARSRPIRQPNIEATLSPKPHRKPASPHGDAEPQSRLTPTQRDALFEEFLHWQGRQEPRSQ